MKLSTAIQLSVALLYSRAVNCQSALWGQCGGIGWTGPTTCAAGSVCTYSNPYYSQCLPGTSSAPPPPPTTVAPPPPPTTTTGSSSPTPTTSTSVSTGPTSACTTTGTLSFNNAALPNPFLFDDGTAVQTKADWNCRRQQIAAHILAYEGGTLPGAPSTLTSTFSKSGTSGTLSITAGNGGATINFAPVITYPSGTMPANGWPLLIALEGGSIPVPAGIATLSYSNSDMAAQDSTSSRGQGLFFNLYGSSATASAMTAWAWGVSRIIDVLESTPSAQIDTTKIGVTGCSRDGKGALWIGAFETRIALTIPQESGSGGDACWRLSLYEQNEGSVVQTATEIVTENVWFSAAFSNYVNNLNSLPYDHHLLLALVAPRALISFENTDYVWLSPLSSWGCVSAARTVYTALGIPDYHGFEQVGGHAHCAWPSSLTPNLDAFFNRFLLGQNVSTANQFATNNVFNNVPWNASQWINWSTPTLS